jgi:hypothetical protein
MRQKEKNILTVPLKKLLILNCFMHQRGKYRISIFSISKAYYKSPCYEGLTNNVSTPLLRTTLNAWPEGTADFVNNKVIKEYIQTTSKRNGVEDFIIYSASVIALEKKDSEWILTYRILKDGTTEAEKKFEDTTLVSNLFQSSSSGLIISRPSTR